MVVHVSSIGNPLSECNGICLYAADIGLPEYGDVVAYAHPDCEEHGDPLEYDIAEDTCGFGEENLRYIREEDIYDPFSTGQP